MALNFGIEVYLKVSRVKSGCSWRNYSQAWSLRWEKCFTMPQLWAIFSVIVCLCRVCLYIRQIYFVFPLLSCSQMVIPNLIPLPSLSLFPLSVCTDSYSAAGSEGSISTSVASLPPQASGSSAPNSPGSRRSVSTLKKWLTNPVRKLSGGATGTAKGERQVRRLEGKPPPPPARSSQDLGSPQTEEQFTILPVIDKDLVRKIVWCVLFS